MYLINNRKTKASYNLALEEYLLKNFETEEDIVCLWQNANAVIIGRNQDYYREIYEPYVLENKIEVIRRMSGGGAVYHDLGNINFTFIKSVNSHEKVSYETFLKPIIDFLRELNINAVFSGRNDITVLGSKISGNAQYLYKNRMLHHGTLLFKVRLDKLSGALNPDITKLERKGIESIRARVTNIYDHLKIKMSTEEFLTKLKKSYADREDVEEIFIDDSVNEKIKDLERSKYLTDDWNINESPMWTVSPNSSKYEKRFDAGLLGVKVQHTSKRILRINFYGDFLSLKPISDLESKLEGVEKELWKKIIQETYKEYFGNLKVEEIIETISNAITNG